VRLTRIYTRGGDAGETSLGSGSRVPKTDPRIEAYGTVDELNSLLGLVLAGELPDEVRPWLEEVQNDLFDVGADLCVPGAASQGKEGKKERLRLTPAYTKRLEEIIDAENASLAPLTSFILPGGARQSAWLHVARNVCRRAERHVTELMEIPAEKDQVNTEVLKYLNRLSDLLFVLARVLNDGGRADVPWKPGARQV
jgi:cob(I)alamin adenosyltransferase